MTRSITPNKTASQFGFKTEKVPQHRQCRVKTPLPIRIPYEDELRTKTNFIK